MRKLSPGEGTYTCDSQKELELSWYQRILPSPFVITKVSMVHGEGNGTPLQYSCLGTPMDGGAWWAAVHGVDRVGHD